MFHVVGSCTPRRSPPASSLASHHITYAQPKLRGIALATADFEDQLALYDSEDEDLSEDVEMEPYEEEFDSSEDFEMEPNEEEFDSSEADVEFYEKVGTKFPSAAPPTDVSTTHILRGERATISCGYGGSGECCMEGSFRNSVDTGTTIYGDASCSSGMTMTGGEVTCSNPKSRGDCLALCTGTCDARVQATPPPTPSPSGTVVRCDNYGIQNGPSCNSYCKTLGEAQGGTNTWSSKWNHSSSNIGTCTCNYGISKPDNTFICRSASYASEEEAAAVAM